MTDTQRNPMDQSSSPMLDTRLVAARDAARAAGMLALDYATRLKDGTLRIEAKGVQDFVSEADQAAEDLIRAELLGAFPDDGFLGEERGTTAGSGGGTWVVDPIDGTGNYVRRIDQWGVSIGYVAEGVRQIGVIYDPTRDRMFTATRGGGAWLNGARLDISTPADPASMLVVLGFSRRRPIDLYLDLIRRLQRDNIEHRRFGSAALGLANLAAGLYDGYIEAHINPWDMMAGALIVEEAGGTVTGHDFCADLKVGGPIAAGRPGTEATMTALLGVVTAGEAVSE